MTNIIGITLGALALVMCWYMNKKNTNRVEPDEYKPDFLNLGLASPFLVIAFVIVLFKVISGSQ